MNNHLSFVHFKCIIEYEWVIYMVCLLPDATLYPFNDVSSTLPVDPANVIMVPVVAEFVIWTLIDIGS